MWTSPFDRLRASAFSRACEINYRRQPELVGGSRGTRAGARGEAASSRRIALDKERSGLTRVVQKRLRVHGGAEDVERQPWIAVIADEAARRSEGVAGDGFA